MNLIVAEIPELPSTKRLCFCPPGAWLTNGACVRGAGRRLACPTSPVVHPRGPLLRPGLERGAPPTRGRDGCWFGRGASRLRLQPARFTLEGELEPPAEGGEAWPNSQLDCYGTWLWALNEHVERGGELTEEHRAAARVVSEYLQAAGTAACFDCWDEHPGFQHTSTLDAVIAGLRVAARLLDEPSATAKADAVVGLLGAEHTLAGAYVRSSHDIRVDASLLWLVVPYDVVELEDPIMRATIEGCGVS